MRGPTRELWRELAAASQDPVLHQGTVAHNLCPFGTKSDEELASALVRARLPADLLGTHVSKNGSNLSSGERQLLCFARAMLEETSILVLDEATSNLDENSDAAMQALLREEYAAKTVITIAHRLLTVADYDTLLVLGGGRLLEQGSPATLLTDPASVLSSMAAALGDEGRAALLDKARQAQGRPSRHHARHTPAHEDEQSVRAPAVSPEADSVVHTRL